METMTRRQREKKENRLVVSFLQGSLVEYKETRLVSRG